MFGVYSSVIRNVWYPSAEYVKSGSREFACISKCVRTDTFRGGRMANGSDKLAPTRNPHKIHVTIRFRMETYAIIIFRIRSGAHIHDEGGMFTQALNLVRQDDCVSASRRRQFSVFKSQRNQLPMLYAIIKQPKFISRINITTQRWLMP